MWPYDGHAHALTGDMDEKCRHFSPSSIQKLGKKNGVRFCPHITASGAQATAAATLKAGFAPHFVPALTGPTLYLNVFAGGSFAQCRFFFPPRPVLNARSLHLRR